MPSARILLSVLLVAGSLAAPGAAVAATIAFTIDVEVNHGWGFVYRGTATAGGSSLEVEANVGDTIRFIIGLDMPTTSGITRYSTTVMAEDPVEIDYLVGSGLDLSGLNFAAVSVPDVTLNDGTPGGAVITSETNPAGSTALDLYRIDYVVQAGALAHDKQVDFSVTGSFIALDAGDLNAGGTASIIVSIPEPGSILLLGGALGALAGISRFRKP